MAIRIWKSLVVAAACVIFAAGFLAGCGKQSPTDSQKAPPELRLGYFPNITHAQAVLEVASGELQAALGSTKLSPKIFNAGPELIQALNAGAIDIGYIGPGPALNAHVASRGQALRVISGAAANGVVIVARPDSGIQSMSDLKGKRLATPSLNNTQDISAKHYLTAVLGQGNSDNVLPINNSEQLAMMVRGNIDAAWVPEPWGARLMSEAGAKLVGEEKDLWPGNEFSLTVVITTPKFLAEHPDMVQKVLRVHHQWTIRLNQNPGNYSDQLNQALAALVGKKMPAAVMNAALSRTKFTDDPLPQTFATMAQWSAQLKVINQTADLSGLIDTAIMSKLAAPPPASQP